MPFKPAIPKIKIKNAQIFGKNFSGKRSEDGKRNFCVYLNNINDIRYKEDNYETVEDFVDALRFDGWNVKQSKYQDEKGNDQYFIPVEVRFDPYPPEILIHTGEKDLEYNEDIVGSLDKLNGLDILDCYVSIRPRIWDDHGTMRVKAFLNKLEMDIDDD